MRTFKGLVATNVHRLKFVQAGMKKNQGAPDKYDLGSRRKRLQILAAEFSGEAETYT